MKPLLGVAAKLEELRFPLLTSPKLDGVRALVINGVVLSRTLKPIPNKFVQSQFSKFEHWDGELIVGEPTSKTCYRDTVSGVMSIEGEPKVRFHAFDHFEHPSQDYRSRVARLKGVVPRNVLVVPQHVVTCLDTLLKLEEKMLNQGYEGLILRDPNGVYKFGRSTVKEGLLLKLKRFKDEEFEIVGYEERLHNGNTATTNELGRTQRSSHKAGKSGRGDLGAFVLRHPSGTTFNVGTGFTDDERVEIWERRDSCIGKTAKIKFFDIGGYEMPRHPVWLGFRDEIDA